MRAKASSKSPEARIHSTVFHSRKAERSQPHLASSPTAYILRLQQAMGNQAVQHLAKSCPVFPRRCPFGGACHTCPARVQAKLKVSQPGDMYEQEADRVAEMVMQMPEPKLQRQPEEEEEEEKIQTKPVAAQITPLAQRQVEKPEEKEEKEEEPLQAKEVPGQISKVTSDLESQINALKGGGQPLPKSLRDFFEPRFGYDFSQVRVHADGQAVETARAMNAQAYTIGKDVVFGAGKYAPETAKGKRLLAHELTHVIQQDQRNLISVPTKESLQTCNIIQRWSLSDHEELTESWVNKTMAFFSGSNMDKKALKTLKDYSTEMDRRLVAICFNLPAVLIGSHENLTKHYKANKSEAQFHGEGGLYTYDLATAREINLAKQKQYEDKARAFWRSTKRKFNSLDECWVAKAAGRENALKNLGYALHIAQDRGAHGEGAIGEGHDKPGFEPDNKDVNRGGWLNAQRNTELVILQASDMLYELLDEKWSRTCVYTRPAEVIRRG